MTKLRRRAVLLAGLFFFNLTMAVGGVSCAMNSSNGQLMKSQDASPAGSMAGMLMGGGQAGTSRSPSGKHVPCDGPGQPGDCNSSVPCSLAVLPVGDQVRVGAVTIQFDRTILALLVPFSRSTSPEPPPPRA